MASRKEDERNERTIRSLLKLPENRRCINCNSLGPQYVCTNFSTFICTTCSGIHREFTHRVKSVSMAKFTTQEVSALQGGGNASARVIYLKEWDTQRNSPPDGSNVERLRDFIKHVYVDRRFTGEKTSEKPLREKMGESERAESYQGSSRSPPYEDPDRRYGGRPSSGGRSPAYGQEIPRSSDNKRSPVHPEVVHDWRREDRFGNVRMSDDRSSLGGRSPDSQRDSDMSSPPVVRPVREILGDGVSPLRVIEPPKATTVGRATDVSVHTQRTASSSSLASDGNSSEVKVEASFIDFDSVPEPPVKATEPQTLKAEGAVSVQLAPSNSDNWANFDNVPQVKVTTAASNSLEALLGLSMPAPASSASPSVGISSFQSSGASVSSSGSPFEIGPATSIYPPSGVPPASLGPAPQPTNTMGNLGASTGGQWPAIGSQALPVYPGTSGQPAFQPPAVAGSSSNMPWNQTVAPNARGPPGISVMHVGQAEVRPNVDDSLGVASEHPSNTKSGERKELPVDLFAMSYAYNPPPVSGWYPRAPYHPGVPMQYNMPMGAPNFQPALRSTNPFDVSSEPSSVQPSPFPSVASLQGALPRIPSQAPAYAHSPPNPYMGQELAGGMVRRPGPTGFSLEEPSFTSLYPNHQLGGAGLHHAHSAPSNFTSTSGNPFG